MARSSEAMAKQNRIEVQEFEQTKYSVQDQKEFSSRVEEQNIMMGRKIDDIFNRMVKTDTYLEKYLPYNNFVQQCEVLHVALDSKNLRKLEDYENSKL